jgi:voltage-gated potassium channel Kch
VLRQILLGSLLAFVTSIVHAGCTAIALRSLETFHAGRWRGAPWVWGAILTAVLVMMMLQAALFESLIWALTYVGVGAISGLDKALYFSIVTFTTLGYGDVVLDERWRVLAALQAANGTIMFGWTTALIIAFVQRVHAAIQSHLKKGRGESEDPLRG